MATASWPRRDGDRDGGGRELHEHRVRAASTSGPDAMSSSLRPHSRRRTGRGGTRIARGNQGGVDETRRRGVRAVAPRVVPTLPPSGRVPADDRGEAWRQEVGRGRAKDEVRRARDAERGAREGFVLEGPRRSDARDPERARGGRGGAQVRRRRRLRRLPLIGYPPALRRVQGHRPVVSDTQQHFDAPRCGLATCSAAAARPRGTTTTLAVQPVKYSRWVTTLTA